MIYFCIEEESAEGPVKIGTVGEDLADDRWRRALARRLKNLQAANPRGLAIVAVMKGGREYEAALHRMFAASRIIGEWFSRSPELDAIMTAYRIEPVRSSMASRSGPPAALAAETIDEAAAARILGVPRRRMRAWRGRGRLQGQGPPFVMLDATTIGYLRSGVEEMAARLQRRPTASSTLTSGEQGR